jgi:cell pole-organizing protein PopZ
MNAPNAQAVHGKETMTEREASSGERSREPSMEDILASIRQIIAGDQPLPLSSRSSVLPPLVRPTTAPPAMFPLRATLQPAARVSAQVEPPPSANPSEPAPDLGDFEPALDFDQPPQPEPASDYATPSPIFSTAEAAASAPEMEPAPAPFPRFEREPIRPEPRREPVAGRQPAVTEAASDSLMSPAAGASVMSSFNTLAATMMMQNMPPLEDIAREMLRPILKVWLDDNLPVLVERLVRAEIERVSRGR